MSNLKNKLYLRCYSLVSDYVLGLLLYNKYTIIDREIDLNFNKNFKNVEEYLEWTSKKIVVHIDSETEKLKHEISDISDIYEMVGKLRDDPIFRFDLCIFFRKIFPLNIFIFDCQYLDENYFDILESSLENTLILPSKFKQYVSETEDDEIDEKNDRQSREIEYKSVIPVKDTDETIAVDSAKDTFLGDETDETIAVDSAKNTFSGDDTDETIAVDSAKNTFSGDDTDETIAVDSAKDTFLGDETDETIAVDSAKNTFSGDETDETIAVDSAKDTFLGDDTDKTIAVDFAKDSFLGDDTDETVAVDSVKDNLLGDETDETIAVDSAKNNLLGDETDETIAVDSAKNNLLGDETDETVAVDSAKNNLLGDDKKTFVVEKKIVLKDIGNSSSGKKLHIEEIPNRRFSGESESVKKYKKIDFERKYADLLALSNPSEIYEELTKGKYSMRDISAFLYRKYKIKKLTTVSSKEKMLQIAKLVFEKKFDDPLVQRFLGTKK